MQIFVLKISKYKPLYSTLRGVEGGKNITPYNSNEESQASIRKLKRTPS